MLQISQRSVPAPVPWGVPDPGVREVPADLVPADVVLCAGTLHGQPAILATTPKRVVCITMPAGETHAVAVPIRQVWAVEEAVSGGFSEVTVLTTKTAIVVSHIPRAGAWLFCRRLREAIATPARKRGKRQES